MYSHAANKLNSSSDSMAKWPNNERPSYGCTTRRLSERVFHSVRHALRAGGIRSPLLHCVSPGVLCSHAVSYGLMQVIRAIVRMHRPTSAWCFGCSTNDTAAGSQRFESSPGQSFVQAHKLRKSIEVKKQFHVPSGPNARVMDMTRSFAVEMTENF